MFRVVKKQVRPNTSVNFFTVSDAEYIAWMGENYIQTGKLQAPEFSVSDNGLELTMSTDWSSEADLIAWRETPLVIEKMLNVMQEYCTANGIVLSTVSAEELV